MSLTIGTGPFGKTPSGQFNFTRNGPDHVLYFDDSPRWVRVVFNGDTVADSRAMKLLHETGRTPVYYFPEDDVRFDLLERSDHTGDSPTKGPARYWSVRVGDRVAQDAAWAHPDPPEGAPGLAGYVAFDWHAMDAWYEEAEQVFVHARDPFSRIDVRESSRTVRVLIDGEVIAETNRPRVLFETGLPPRYYIPEEDVRRDLLEPSDRHTECPYKGTASYWSVNAGGRLRRDLVWYYPDPLPEVAPIKGYVAFYNERVDLEVDGEDLSRPKTKFS